MVAQRRRLVHDQRKQPVPLDAARNLRQAIDAVKVGDKFTVFNVGEALVDPSTGAKLGADEKKTGDGAVVEVQPKYAIISFTGKAAAKDTVRKP